MTTPTPRWLARHIAAAHDTNPERETFLPDRLAGGGGQALVAPTGNPATDTATLQAAIDSGPGRYLPGPGTYVVTGLTIRSGVHLAFPGVGASTVRLAPGTTGDLIATAGFAALTGSGDNTAGAGGWSISGTVLDGNKANAAGGFGVRAYGYDFDLRDLHIKNCAGDGLYTEWANFGGSALPEASMEARLTNVKIHDNGGNGWHHRGPHDSYAVNVVIFHNAGVGYWPEASAAGHYTAAGTSLVHCHIWGDHTVGVIMDTQTHLVSCQVEGALTGQVLARAGDCSIVGGFVFYLLDVGTNPGYGVRIGDTGKPCTGLRMDAKLSGFAGTSAGTAAIDFANPGGSNSIDALVYGPTGQQITGTPSPNDRLRISVAGRGSPAGNAAESRNQVTGAQTFEVGAANTAWTIQNGQQDQLNFNTNTKRMELVGGYTYRLYRDPWYSEPTVDLNGALGTVRTYGAATASRPAAATAGQGAMFYDTTLGRPIWSDGGQWRDAAGVVA